MFWDKWYYFYFMYEDITASQCYVTCSRFKEQVEKVKHPARSHGLQSPCQYIFFSLLFFWKRAQVEEGQKKREKERLLSGSTPSTEPEDMGLKFTTVRDHDLSQNQKSDTEPIEPPRHPFIFKVISTPNMGLVLMTLRPRSHALLTEPSGAPCQ